MSDKKLYEVTLEFTYYAYAADESEAAEYADDAIRDSFTADYTHAREVTHDEWPISADWDSGSLVYHDGTEGDLELGTLLKKLPERKAR